MPWDNPEDPAALRDYAADRDIGFDAMNSNTFQDNPSTTENGRVSYKFGSAGKRRRRRSQGRDRTQPRRHRLGRAAWV